VLLEIGRAEISEDDLSEKQLHDLDRALEALGFERVTDRRRMLAEQAKAAIRAHVRDENHCRLNLSACLSEQLHMGYDAVSRMFSQIEGVSIEKYHIAQRVEFVKELISYGELTLSEIADKAGYNSVSHLSRQFKDVTGVTTTQFMADGAHRTAINEL
ncbi:MAG: AraC family transcriptional regulator, partial [Muribaculaceae bacterium]|nr:AraC family transcriptional regulator [Muribaculaceae bacterium]